MRLILDRLEKVRYILLTHLTGSAIALLFNWAICVSVSLDCQFGNFPPYDSHLQNELLHHWD